MTPTVSIVPHVVPHYHAPQAESMESVLKQLKEEFPGVTFWWGRATEEWWALVGNRGFESKTLDGLLTLVRRALAETDAHARAAAASPLPQYATRNYPTPAPRPQTGAAGRRPPHPHTPGPAYRLVAPTSRPARVVRASAMRQSRFRRCLDAIRRFFFGGDGEYW
ncbi:hypothetical protein [Actinomadura sp. 6N118]|uniref:hypothetical protein n=1 Tax=Actinomadura sp. 6N118 TaxID=3375151 RepID=UPI0037ADEC1F